ncbi:MAG: hypothetical protein OEW98_12425, partial [Betaproteobacteria bacterium]|nr:hypothetical protein [Betaproteobacteria bacterium]
MVSFTVRVVLVVFNDSDPKSTATGDNVATGAVGVGAMPLPVRLTLCGLPAAPEAMATDPVYAATAAGA